MHGKHAWCVMQTCMLMAALGTAAGMSRLQAQGPGGCKPGPLQHVRCCASLTSSATGSSCAAVASAQCTSHLMPLTSAAASCCCLHTCHICPHRVHQRRHCSEATCCCRSQHVPSVASVSMECNDTMHARMHAISNVRCMRLDRSQVAGGLKV